MRCPYCAHIIHFEPRTSGPFSVPEDARFLESDGYDVAYGHCPSCREFIILYREGSIARGDYGEELGDLTLETIVFPKFAGARQLPPEVPAAYAADFREAEMVLPISPKASAAISRRLLQEILRTDYSIHKKTLAQEMDEFIKLPGIPSEISEAVDAIRNIGNFAAHPLKDTSTGLVIPVEPGEAEWLLEVLESLFDLKFVQPQRLASRKAALNNKLKAVGQPPMKKP